MPRIALPPWYGSAPARSLQVRENGRFADRLAFAWFGANPEYDLVNGWKAQSFGAASTRPTTKFGPAYASSGYAEQGIYFGKRQPIKSGSFTVAVLAAPIAGTGNPSSLYYQRNPTGNNDGVSLLTSRRGYMGVDGRDWELYVRDTGGNSGYIDQSYWHYNGTDGALHLYGGTRSSATILQLWRDGSQVGDVAANSAGATISSSNQDLYIAGGPAGWSELSPTVAVLVWDNRVLSVDEWRELRANIWQVVESNPRSGFWFGIGAGGASTGIGASTGAATAAAVAGSIAAAFGTSAAAANAGSIASAAGVAAASALSGAIGSSAGASAAVALPGIVAQAAGVGAATGRSGAIGAATCVAVAAAWSGAIGIAVGSSSATAYSLAASIGSAAGTSSATALSGAIAQAAGASTAAGYSSASSIAQADGSSSGLAIVGFIAQATGASTAIALRGSVGQAAATAAAIALCGFVAQAAGTSSAAGVGLAGNAGVGTAAGASAAAGRSGATARAFGTSVATGLSSMPSTLLHPGRICVAARQPADVSVLARQSANVTVSASTMGCGCVNWGG